MKANPCKPKFKYDMGLILRGDLERESGTPSSRNHYDRRQKKPGDPPASFPQKRRGVPPRINQAKQIEAAWQRDRCEKLPTLPKYSGREGRGPGKLAAAEGLRPLKDQQPKQGPFSSRAVGSKKDRNAHDHRGSGAGKNQKIRKCHSCPIQFPASAIGRCSRSNR